MKRILLIFSCAVLVGGLSVFGYFRLNRDSQASQSPIAAVRLTETVSTRPQIYLNDIPEIKRSGYRTLIDLRPDGEAQDQPSAAAVEQAAYSVGLKFSYIPVSPGKLSDDSVAQLLQAIQSAEEPILLYCRSGSRAARAWALAEASRAGGLTAEKIALIVREAGFLVDDIKPTIDARVEKRHMASN